MGDCPATPATSGTKTKKTRTIVKSPTCDVEGQREADVDAVPDEVSWECITILPLCESQTLSTSQSRVMIQSRSCDLFFPKGSSSFDEIFRHTNSNDLAVTAACDALCALRLGTMHGDRGMLFEYRRLYGTALRRLRKGIERADKTTSLDSIMATVYLSAICELFTSTNFASPGYKWHTLGLLSLYNTHESRRAKPGVSSYCFLQWRYMFPLGYGLVAKRDVRYRLPRWTDERRTRYPLTSYVMRVPCVLEKLEALRVERATSSNAVEIISGARELRESLHECIIENSMTASDVPYYTTSINEYPQFKTKLGDLGAVYPAVYCFSDITSAELHRSFWTCLLVMGQAIVDVRALLWDDLEDLESDQLDAIENELPGCADHLCRSLPWYSSPEINTAGPTSLLDYNCTLSAME